MDRRRYRVPFPLNTTLPANMALLGYGRTHNWLTDEEAKALLAHVQPYASEDADECGPWRFILECTNCGRVAEYLPAETVRFCCNMARDTANTEASPWIDHWIGEAPMSEES